MNKLVLSITLLLSTLYLMAQQDVAVKFVATKNKDVNAAFNFVQYNVDPLLNKSETLKGKLTFAAPRKLSMIYSVPEGDKFVIDGDFLVNVKGKKTNKVNLKKVKSMAGLADLLCNAMMGKISEIEHDTKSVMTFTSGKTTFVFVFKADKKSRSYYKEVEVRYDKKTGRIVYMKLIEKSGKYSEYQMTAKT